MVNTQTILDDNVKPDGANQAGIRAWMPLLVFFLFTIAVTLAGYAVFHHYKESIKSDKQNELGGIAELKTRQITSWMEERKGDAQALRNDPLFLAEVERWLQQGAPAGAGRTKLIEHLAALQQAYAAYGYTSICLLDDQGMPRLSSTEHDPIQQKINRHALESMRSGQPIFSDIHLKKRGTGKDLEIDLTVPLSIVREGRVRTIGAVLFHIDPRNFLFPLIQRWPTPSPSAENLLVRREGDEVVFLNELRHLKNTPLAMRFPLSQKQLLATRAAMGEEGFMEGVDYRGVPVIGMLSKVPGTSWFMVSKIDQAEIYAPINQLANWMLLLMLALAGTGGGIAIFWWQKEKRHYKNGLERQALAKHLDYLGRYANDIILLLDGKGAVVDSNDRACEALGYTAAELLGLNIDDLRAIDFSPPSAERFRQIDRAGGALLFESMFAKRNGAVFPIEVSVRQIEIGGEKFYQGISRDITERKQAENELLRQKKLLRQIIDSDPNLIFAKDGGGRFLFANEAMAQGYGQTTGDIVGKCNADLVHNPEQLVAYDSANREVLENRQERVAIEAGVLADGKNHWFKTIRKLLPQDDGSASVLTIAMDVTELKEVEENLQKTNRALRLLSTGNAALVHAAEEGQLLPEICQLIVDTGAYRMAWIGMVEHDQEKTVRPVASFGFEQDYLSENSIGWADTERGSGPTGRAIRTGLTQVNQNVLSNPLMEPWRAAALARGYQSSIALPLRSGAQTFGVLTIYSATPDSFSPDEVILLEELANNLAWGIAALRLSREHEQAVAKLRQSEEHFRFLTENASDMIYLMSVPDGRYRYVSPSSSHLTGYTPEEFYHSPMLMHTLIHPDSHAYCEEQWGKLLLGEIPAYFEFQIMHKSGQIRWMHQRNAPIWAEDGSGTLVAVQGVVTDISEQKRTEEQLLEQKTFLHQIVDADPNLIYVKDAAGKFLMVNQALANFYGLTVREMIGKTDGAINLDRKGLAGFLEPDTEAFLCGQEIMLTESSVTENGKQHCYLTIKKPLPQADGSVNVLGIAVDITGQKLSEMKLDESYRELQRLTSHLENVREEERMRIARELHDEMGATLAALKMRAAWLASRLPPELTLLLEEADHISGLVSDGVQTVRQIVRKLRPTLLENVGLDAAIEDYVRQFRLNTNIECILVLPEERLILEADQSSAIFRILQESLSNVAKHAQASKVDILFSRRSNSLTMVVEDNGLGFVQKHRDKSFGLIGIRERALMAGGKAKINGARGRGVRVSVTVPVYSS